MKHTVLPAILAIAIPAIAGSASAADDCTKLAASIRTSVEADNSKVLEIVEKQIGANEACACEVVKAAIEASKADAAMVASIVETASSVAPEQMRLISQCAVAVAPDALAAVQAVLVRLDPGKGEVTYTDAKSAPKAPIETAPAWNPLDFPGEGIGPNPGGPGGFSELEFGDDLPLLIPYTPFIRIPGPATPTDLGPDTVTGGTAQ